MKRNHDAIRRRRCKVRDQKRLTWCTYEHFEDMYDSIYKRMVEAGVATKNDNLLMFDKEGNEVDDENKMYGRKTRYRMTCPDNVVFVDETGSNTNQKDDGYIGGRLHVMPKGATESGVIGSTTDIHFSVLCFTSGSGQPIMCAVILKSNKDISELPDTWKLGIDIRKTMVEGENELNIFTNNFGENKGIPGGPRCTYNGKLVPCFVGCSPKASITSELLKQMLEQMDRYMLFDRTEGKMPFLLLDGHQSRFQLPFLKYINDSNHPWMVCFGVPYGTHIWQVQDSSELNGVFKIELAKAKAMYLKFKPANKQRFVPSDIIPLLNTAWEKSFAIVSRGRKAIVERGWGPLNYVLLDHPEISRQQQPENQQQQDDQQVLVQDHIDHGTNLIERVNSKGPMATGYLDILIDKGKKDEGRRRRYLVMKGKEASREILIQKVKKKQLFNLPQVLVQLMASFA